MHHKPQNVLLYDSVKVKIQEHLLYTATLMLTSFCFSVTVV